MKNFADSITRLRKEKGLTQRQVAEVLGVSDKAVSKWERGETMPDVALLPSLAEFYGVSLDELLQREGSQEKVIEETEDKKILNKFIKKHIACIIAADCFIVIAFAAWLTAGFFTDNGWKNVAFSFAVLAYLAAHIINFVFLTVKAEKLHEANARIKKYSYIALLHCFIAAVLFIACGGLFYTAAEYVAASITAAGVLIVFLLRIFREKHFVKSLVKYKIGALIPSIVTAAICLFMPFAVLTGEGALFEIRITVINAIADFEGLKWSVPFFVLLVGAVAYTAVAVCKNLPCWSILALWTAIGIFAVILTGKAEKDAIELYSEVFSFGSKKTVAGAFVIYSDLIFTIVAAILHYYDKKHRTAHI